MPNYIFSTPYVEEGIVSPERLFIFRKRRVGKSVIKQGGVYSVTRFPVDPGAESYQEFYQGGKKHIVDETTKAALIAANIGITEANFTAE
jgi:hypothetical protein